MPIKYNYEVSVSDNKAKLNKDIFLFRGNRNIHYYFSIKGARFTFSKENENLLESSNAIYAAITVIKPNGVEVANAIAPVEDGLIHLKVTEDLIDEEVEVGDFDLVFDLFDDSDGAVTIPKIKGQFHVQERPCTTSIGTLSGNVNVVNQAVVDLAIATQENEQLIVVDDDGKYVKTTWVKGDKISIERLNKIEEGIEKNSTQYKDIADKIKNIGQPTQEQINTAIDKAIEDGKITGGGINSTAKNLLQTILQNAVYTTNQNANITALMSALGSTESGGDTPTIKTYTITNKLTNCTNSNISTSVDENSNYVATISPSNGYTLTGAIVSVTMGGIDITSTVYSNGTINIAKVTGNIIITANSIDLESNLKEFALSAYDKWVNGANSVTGYSAFEIVGFANNIVDLPTSTSEIPNIECDTLTVVSDSAKRTAAKELISGVFTTTNYLGIKILSEKLETASVEGFKTYLKSNIINAKLKIFDNVNSFEIPTTNWNKIITNEKNNIYHFEHDIDTNIYEAISNANSKITNIGELGDYTVNLKDSKLIMTIPDYANNNFTADDVITYYNKYNVIPYIYYI